MKIQPIETGFFSTDGGAMFGIVSRKVWARKYPVNEDNRCPLTMRVLFADLGEHKVLFDTGVGPAMVDGMSYYHFHGLRNMVHEIEKRGFTANDITDVVLSHLHFDHCGGSVVSESGAFKPAFPNATYWASSRQWEMAQQPPLWESDSFAPAVIQVLKDAGQLKLLDRDQELFEGVRVKFFQGHTDDQMVSYVSDGSDTFVFCGDVIPMEPHILPLCIAAVDNSAVVSVDEKIRLLDEAGTEGQILFFYHDAVTQAVRMKKTNGRISVKEKFSFR
ncbi:MAG TPA: MBL fold metallo-hydrolase [Bacteroidales bacterium]|nr:MBL fold metallo-hydrolase [Bacteroidales bacterium]